MQIFGRGPAACGNDVSEIQRGRLNAGPLCRAAAPCRADVRNVAASTNSFISGEMPRLTNTRERVGSWRRAKCEVGRRFGAAVFVIEEEREIGAAKGA